MVLPDAFTNVQITPEEIRSRGWNCNQILATNGNSRAFGWNGTTATPFQSAFDANIPQCQRL